jgi:hypothetical protein
MLPEALIEQLAHYNIHDYTEVALREALEQRAETYTLIRLAPWPARRWKCHYRLLMGSAMHDAQSVPEAYALGLLALLQQATTDQVATSTPGDA